MANKLNLYRIHFTFPGTKVDFFHYEFAESPQHAICRATTHHLQWSDFDAVAELVEGN